jgi:AcrR family transcriptional regulator
LNGKLVTNIKYHHGDLKNALILAAIDILAEEGVHSLSLRKVAARAGVSHAAPYAHFSDKQALIAAVSTEGYSLLFAKVREARDLYPMDPLRQLVEGAWAYVSFALTDPAHFKITLSGVVEKERDYPALVEATANGFKTVVEIVEACQETGILKPSPPDIMTVSIWGTIHGLVTLVLEGQLSHVTLERYSIRKMLLHSLSHFIQVPIPSDLYEIKE